MGRPKKCEQRNKAQDYPDECQRVEVECKFSLAKRKCGMGMVMAKLKDAASHLIAVSVLVLNLRKIQCIIFQLLGGVVFRCKSKNGGLFRTHYLTYC